MLYSMYFILRKGSCLNHHADKVGSVPEEEQNTGFSGEFDGEPGTEHKYGHGGISKAAVCPSNISITLLIDGLCDG